MGARVGIRRGCGRGLAMQWGGACPANYRLRRVQLFVTEMAEGELDIDSLISRLLEGKVCNYISPVLTGSVPSSELRCFVWRRRRGALLQLMLASCSRCRSEQDQNI